MSWLFWRRNKETVMDVATEVRETVQMLQKNLSELGETTDEQKTEIRRLARVQYKVNKESAEKSDHLEAELTKLLQGTQEAMEGKKWRHLVESHLRLLDDLDLALSHLKTSEDSRWPQLLNSWIRQTLIILEEMGLQEISVLGKVFQAGTMEGVQVVSRDAVRSSNVDLADAPPCTVVNVLARGFMTDQGRVLRKSQVVTIEEE